MEINTQTIFNLNAWLLTVLDSVYWYKQGCHNITDVLLDSCVLLSNTIQLIAHEISYPIWRYLVYKGCGMYYQKQYQADME
ncbi:MAG: hypothetical protein IPN94_19335 [Sphingobacteriales bacterium]|nr:hypothetical protein [Sphingobacteriales bacterium]